MNIITNIQKRLAWTTLYAIALATTLSISSTQSPDGALATKQCRILGSQIIGLNELITQFFSSSDSTPYNDFFIIFNKKENHYKQQAESMSPVGKLSQKSHTIICEALKYFSAFIGVIKQYNGKSADHALNFVSDMDKVFSLELAFNNIITKLQSLQQDAESAQEDELITIIQQLVAVLQNKKNEWNKKNNLSLLTGLTKRMGK